MTEPSVVAALRMRALRFEESEDWAAARDAWHEALAALKEVKGTLVYGMEHEFHARAIAADSRADEPMGQVQPLHKVEALAKADDQPTAVHNLEAGETQGDTGAR
jgi:hypothetical protein